MENLCSNENLQSSEIAGIKSVSQVDNVNSAKSDECGQGDDFRNKILDQNTCEETSSVGDCETGDGSVNQEKQCSKDDESCVTTENEPLANEEDAHLTANKVLEQEDPKCGEDAEPSDAVEEQQDASDDRPEEPLTEMTSDENPGSMNEASNMDVEEGGSLTNAEEMQDKDDLEENLSQDDEVSMNPSETNVNPAAEEETSMNVSEGGEGEDQSMDQDMQVEKENTETMDVSMTNVDVHDESMEVASPNDEDPIGLMNGAESNKDAGEDEQMEVNETAEESAKPDDEVEKDDDETRGSSKETEEIEETSKEAEKEDSVAKPDEPSEDTSVAKEKDKPESTEAVIENADEEKKEEEENKNEKDENKDDKSKDDENKDDKSKDDETKDDKSKDDETKDDTAASKESDKEGKEDDDGPDVSASADTNKEVTTENGDDATKETANESKDKEDDELLCIIPDTVLRVGEKPGEKSSVVLENNRTILERPGKPTRKSSAEKKADEPYMASIERVEQRSSRPQRQAAKRAETQIKELAEEDSNSNEGFGDGFDDVLEVEPSTQMCFQCCRLRLCSFQVYVAGKARFLCQDECLNLFRKHGAYKSRPSILMNNKKGIDPDRSFIRKCSQCCNMITGDEKNLSWETMDFCNEECLGKYQTALGSHCANCKGSVQPVSLGKYCVRFGYDIKQFCCSTCLEEFKKGLKVCSYCQKDISSGVEGFLAPVGDKGQFKDFCTQACMEKYDQMSNNQPPPVAMHQCAVCNNEKVVKVEVILDNKLNKLCSEPCFAAFKFVNKINADHCDMCKKYFDKSKTEVFSVYYDDAPHSFCCKTCMNVYILANRKIVPCNWCKVKKYNFDMIKRVTTNGQILMMCSLNCLTLYQVSVNAVSSKRIKCDLCNSVAQAQYHLTMSDATIRNFCSYQCVMSFQGQYNKSAMSFAGEPTPVPTAGNKTPGSASMPVISNVTSLATPNGQPIQNNAGITTRSGAIKVNNNSITPQGGKSPPMTFKQQVIVKPPPPKQMKNKALLCKPYMHTKGVSCRPHPCTKETQTEETIGKKVLIPVPVPIYVPSPMHMYSSPYPVPVPFPLPVPVPIFIPTTRNSAHGIMKEIKRIQEKIPTDPFEAELLMMAEMVAGEKKGENSDSESDDGGNGAGDVSEVPGGSSAAEGGFSPEAVDTSNTFGEDMLQMALKMASELEEPAVDLEAALTPSTITAQSQTSMEQNDATESEVDDPEPAQALPETRANRGRKRGMRTSSTRGVGGTPSKRGRRISSSVDIPLLPPPEPQTTPRVEQEKPDANMCLKYTFGVNAWRQWVMTKNAELEKAASSNRKLKLFKPEILQLTADELNYSLCLFVKEVRKPNGSEYAPDTIYYLCLGIQQYLFENGRIDNIFTDSYYEKFTECLDEVAKKFTALYNDSQYIVTRVEEEHLWESKQLGAHSPHVLLSTLMFFNTKHFNLTTVEEHMQLSFSHIMKHWKRNPNQPGVTKIPGSSRNVLLRFYPPQSALESNARKKKVYEQQENEENPLRCPVKLYEFYLSKCPESVKTRNDVFYLLPERSCVPDSPVWYSTMALGKEPLIKMLHRVKMVKEINIALLTS